VQNLVPSAPVRGQVQNLEGLPCAIISGKPWDCQVKNYCVDAGARV
jgi:hypothetical protein